MKLERVVAVGFSSRIYVISYDRGSVLPVLPFNFLVYSSAIIRDTKKMGILNYE